MTGRWSAWSLMVAILVGLGVAAPVRAQFFGRGGAVGGIVIDANGRFRQWTDADRAEMVRAFRRIVDGAEGELQRQVPVRRISLRGLEAACRDFVTAHPGETLPDELLYLGGLVGIDYVIADPETKDILIAGPAEGWKLDEAGNVVGVTTGRPVLKLEDLVVALRHVDQAARERITCSIDPTEEGHRRLTALLQRQRNPRARLDAARLAQAVKQAYGLQTVRIGGVPKTSRFAQVLVAADYQMKRLAMGLDRSPVPGIPSYVSLLRKNPAAASTTQPRWWLAPDFDPVARSDDGLAFAITRAGVRVMTEDEFLAEDGRFRQTGRKSRAAQAFADAVTKRYDELAEALPIFGELRNLMVLSTVAAIIERQELLEKSGVSLPLLLGDDDRLPTTKWNAPTTVPPECSIVRVRGGLLVTASGGVEIDSWELAKATATDRGLSELRETYRIRGGTTWWSN